MIVRRVELKNFTSYREAAVEFPRDAVAIAIVGPNGAGKSSILDAIYYALYGESLRGNIRELIRLGANNMQVSVSFEAGGEEYLIVRKASINARGRLQSEVHLYRLSGGRRRLLARSSKEVAREVTRLLGVDKAMFTSAYYVRQGEIAALLSMEPSQRKRLVARLLGLDYFEAAYEKLREVRVEYEKNVLEKLRRDVEEKKRLQEELLETRKNISLLEEKARELKSKIGEIEVVQEGLAEKLKRVLKKLEELRKIDKEYNAVREKLLERRRMLAELEEEYRRYEQLKEELEKMSQKLSTLEPYIKARDAARQLVENREKLNRIRLDMEKLEENLRLLVKLEPLAKQYLKLKETLKSLEEEEKNYQGLLEKKKGLEERYSTLKEKIRDLEARLSKYLDAAKVDEEVDADTLYKLLASLEEEKRRALDAARKSLDEAKAEAEKLKARKTQLVKWLRSLAELREPRCPLCGSPLTEEHKAELKRQFASELKAVETRLEELSKIIEERRGKLEKAEKEYREISRLNPQEGAQLLRELKEAKAKATKVEGELRLINEKLTLIREKLKPIDSIREKLQELEKDYHHYLYLKDSEEEVKRELAELKKQAEELASTLSSARLTLKQLGLEDVDPGEIEEKAEQGIRLKLKLEERRKLLEGMSQLQGKIASLKKEVDELEKKAEALKKLVGELPIYERRELEVREDLKKAGELKGKLEGELKGVEERLRELHREKAQLEEKVKALGDVEKKLAAAEKVHKDVEKIRQAFHRDGAPKLIREKAVPRIERLTREFLSLFNLEIGEVNVTDDFSLVVGSGGKQRGIATLSGGEQAVAALSFRLAIARSTVEGRGLLMFDEPTANLDEERRQMLVEALKRLFSSGDSPRQMILVTHDRELEDAADAVYEVKRTPHGSIIEPAS